MSNVILVQSILGIFLFFVLELNLNFVHRSFLGCVIYLLFVVGRVGPWTQCGPLLPLPLPLGSTGRVQGGGAACPGPRPSVRQGGRVSLVFSSPAGGPGCNTLLGYLQPPTLDVPFPGVIESRVWRPPPQFAAVEIRIQFLSPQSPIPPSLWEPTDPGVGVPAPATPTSGADVWPEIREPTSVSCGKS